MKTELLAPAGDIECAYAAFHYGADAIYLGLRRFSARAEAANFSPEDLGEILAYAHAATPRRSVFLALNTLVTDEELGEALEALDTAASLGIDAVILQDLGLAHLARRLFPGLERHASTQLAIHNVAGARAARELGFGRVTLAREVTMSECARIAREGGLPVEAFIHGALCYSVSGLCLYSSLLRGRSGNRGRCAYPCRESFSGSGGESRYPFSMKDLALTGDVRALREAGVHSFKIEGRKKSPLYVAAVTRYYRGLLDGTLSDVQKREAEEDIKTIFSRPWTELYARSSRNRDVADAEIVGHRGARIGQVESLVKRGGETWLRFRSQRALQRHDGIQVDLPGAGRPFGFPVDHLCREGASRRLEPVFEAPAGAVVEIQLPRERPELPYAAALYCSSSQEVKQRYRYTRPKPGEFKVRTPVAFEVVITSAGVQAQGRILPQGGPVSAGFTGPLEPCHDPGKVGTAVEQAFSKLGDTAFVAASVACRNAEELFVPVSRLNPLRREVVSGLARQQEESARARHAALRVALEPGPRAREMEPRQEPAWSVKTDRVAHLDHLEEANLARLEEVVVDIGRDSLETLEAGLASLATRMSAQALRLALPLMARATEWDELAHKVAVLSKAGWARWQAGSLWGLAQLEQGAQVESLSTDWPVYVTNGQAAQALIGRGVASFTLSPELDELGYRALLPHFQAEAVVILYQDTPLYISESCALASMAGHCPAGPACRDSERDWTSESGETVRLVQHGCRSVLLGAQPFCLAGHQRELVGMGARHLRADFVWRRYDPATVAGILAGLMKGHPVRGHVGNYRRGLS